MSETYGITRQSGVDGLFRVVVGYVDEEVALACLHGALAELPTPPGGHRAGHLENTLAAVAAAWACGLDEAFISNGLQKFAGFF